MNQGIALVDREGKVLIFNKRAVEYSGIDETQFALPADVKEIFAAQWANGEFGADGELLPDDVREYFLKRTGTLPKSYVRHGPTVRCSRSGPSSCPPAAWCSPTPTSPSW